MGTAEGSETEELRLTEKWSRRFAEEVTGEVGREAASGGRLARGVAGSVLTPSNSGALAFVTLIILF